MAIPKVPIQVPLNPDFLQYSRIRGQINHRINCRVPPPIKLPQIRPPLSESLFLPSAYDLRQLGRVSPVGDQGQLGACWAFATYGSLESNLLPGQSYNFSENNLINEHGFDFGPADGGIYSMSTAYLARWSGPVFESDDPYTGEVHPSPPGLTARKHVQEVLYLPERNHSLDNNLIKQAIMDYGGVFASITWDDNAYNRNTFSYYYSGVYLQNHSITVVGWDDNFSRTNFSVTPPGDGAFILKNSWGKDFGDKGYFYLSYYDTRFVAEAIYNNAESTTNYNSSYQYDPLGMVTAIYYDDQESIWMANTFQAGANQSISAVSFYTLYPNTVYEITIVDNSTQFPSNGTKTGTNAGTISSPGYHTVSLGSPIPVTTEKMFSVIVKLTTPGFTSWAGIERNINGYSSNATSSPGQSFISSDGANWLDLFTLGFGNICVKAFSLSTNRSKKKALTKKTKQAKRTHRKTTRAR